MSSSLWEIFSIFSLTLVSPFVGATEPVNLPLPQPVDYVHYMRSQLTETPFSADPIAQQGLVAGQHTGQPRLEAFIINYKNCIALNDLQTYRLFVRNTGDGMAENVSVVFSYPVGVTEFRIANPPPVAEDDPANGVITWDIGNLEPGAGRELLVTLNVTAPAHEINTEMTAVAGAKSTLTSHTVPGCEAPPNFQRQPLPENKYPAIVCDPAEINCAGTLDEIAPKLGVNFRRVHNNRTLVPTICSPNDPDPLGCVPNLPALGPRFAEAVADIIPGDCRVMDDDIISTPPYHNALNRRARPAAAYMFPLYESGQDFKKLVHENDLLGLSFFQEARLALARIHTKHWQKQAEDIRQVLEEQLSTDDIRPLINRYHADWRNETGQEQQDLERKYRDLQTDRKGKFDPVAHQAVQNAKNVLQNTCGLPDTDGGLQELLFGDPAAPQPQETVKKNYEESLDQRTAAFTDTQLNFLDPSPNWLPEIHLPQTWQITLRQALDEFDQGNKKPLETYLANIPEEDRIGFSAVWALTYKEHAKQDQKSDENIRLQYWQKALESPKTIATDCEKENVFSPPVEITWCESGDYEEFIVRNSPLFTKKARNLILPPIDIEGGYDTAIDPQRVVGVSCGGRPGDPFWSYDCSCSCNELVPNMRDGNILFCQAGGRRANDPRQMLRGQESSPVPNDSPPNEEEAEEARRFLPIIRHDMPPITTRAECLRETPRHTQPDPNDPDRIRF